MLQAQNEEENLGTIVFLIPSKSATKAPHKGPPQKQSGQAG